MIRSKDAVEASQNKLELAVAIDDFVAARNMSDVEVLQALTSYMQSTLKYMLRFERHGDYETPADVEKE